MKHDKLVSDIEKAVIAQCKRDNSDYDVGTDSKAEDHWFKLFKDDKYYLTVKIYSTDWMTSLKDIK